MLAFRRLLARRTPALRFSSSDSDSSDSYFAALKALTIEDQIEGINKSLEDVNVRISICEETIVEKSKAIQNVLRETYKAPLEYVHPSETPDVSTILKALEKMGDALKVLSIDDSESETPDETKILKGVEDWACLKDGFEDYYSPMRDVEKDLKLVASVRIMKARVNDVRKRLQNDKE